MKPWNLRSFSRLTVTCRPWMEVAQEDYLLTVLMSKGLNLLVGNAINLSVGPITLALAMTQPFYSVN